MNKRIVPGFKRVWLFRVVVRSICPEWMELLNQRRGRYIYMACEAGG
jgi:hypothetical protein